MRSIDSKYFIKTIHEKEKYESIKKKIQLILLASMFNSFGCFIRQNWNHLIINWCVRASFFQLKIDKTILTHSIEVYNYISRKLKSLSLTVRNISCNRSTLIRCLFKLSLSIIITSTIHQSGTSQKIISLGYNKYQVDDMNYNYDKMQSVFSVDLKAKLHYDLSLKTAKKSKSYGVATLASLYIGVISAYSTLGDEERGFFSGETVAYIAIYGLAPVFGTIFVVARINTEKHKKRAISLYNSGYSYSLSSDDGTYISYGLQKHGLGIGITF